MLSPSQRKAIAALVTSKTREQAAAAAGISPRTLRTYFENPEFVREYRSAFAGLVDEATRHAQRNMSPAIDTLLEIMQDADISPAARVAAARSTLEYSLQLSEMNDFNARLSEIEKRLTDEAQES